MNSIIEVAKFEPGPTFENNIIEIKDNYLKIIPSTDMSISDISLFGNNLNSLL